MSESGTPALVFISYSRKDREFKDELVDQLRVIFQEPQVFVDDDMGPGEKWEDRIEQAIDEAAVAILVVSRHSLSSPFIREKEVTRLLARRDEARGQGLFIIPLIYRDCAWRKLEWLSELNVRPRGGEPLFGKEPAERDTMLMELVEEIADVISTLRAQSEPEPEHALQPLDRAGRSSARPRELADSARKRELMRASDRLARPARAIGERRREAALPSRPFQVGAKEASARELQLRERKADLQRELAAIMEAEKKRGRDELNTRTKD